MFYVNIVWYLYILDMDGMMIVISCEWVVSDICVWVYIGECGIFESLELVVSSDDNCGDDVFILVVVDFLIVVGIIYYIEWDNGWSDDFFGWELILDIQVFILDVIFQVDMNFEVVDLLGVFVVGFFSEF